jgi:hypothetical protein
VQELEGLLLSEDKGSDRLVGLDDQLRRHALRHRSQVLQSSQPWPVTLLSDTNMGAGKNTAQLKSLMFIFNRGS